eukprot:TRINITY_DN1488_c0_g1_i1.p1 TRINITY_DN1488_c0_g1~~TRINITY_DN1488_c0_g1_i1.p1  ORF type:complete len:234 (-),score=63.92 TRINITY_DN1488_c0_g1_i1:220-900(-)
MFRLSLVRRIPSRAFSRQPLGRHVTSTPFLVRSALSSQRGGVQWASQTNNVTSPLVVSHQSYSTDELTLAQRLTEDMKSAMRAKQKDRLLAIRTIKSHLLNKEKELQKDVDDATAFAVINKMIREADANAEEFLTHDRPEMAQKEKDQKEVFASYLPEQLSEDELQSRIKAVVDGVVADTRAASKSVDMKLMGTIMTGAKDAVGTGASSQDVARVVKGALSAAIKA